MFEPLKLKVAAIVIKEKFDLGLYCINIAPEFGYIQTCAILENLFGLTLPILAKRKSKIGILILEALNK